MVLAEPAEREFPASVCGYCAVVAAACPPCTWGGSEFESPGAAGGGSQQSILSGIPFWKCSCVVGAKVMYKSCL